VALSIEVGDESTWPAAFAKVALRSKQLIISYKVEADRIERLGYDDVYLRNYPPPNEFKAEYTTLVDSLEGLLTPHSLVGYHCTRITSSEAANIRSHGLLPLSADLVKQKLDQCHADGHLTSNGYEYLKSSEHIALKLRNGWGNRTGMLWFCAHPSTLQSSGHVCRLFNSWGGEAIYKGHEEDPKIDLSNIGSPVIVKCAVPFHAVTHYWINFTERFLAQLVAADIAGSGLSADFDFHTNKPVHASSVLATIDYSDPRFEGLTRCQGWKGEDRISPPVR
jgi:hypothetical protein